MLPFLLIFVTFHIIPIFFAVQESLFRQQSSGLGLGESVRQFVGLGNYTRAFGDSTLYAAGGRVLLYGVVQVPIMLFLALGMALAFDSALVHARQFLQVVAFLPYAIPGVIGAILWAFLYVPGISPIVSLLQDIGAPSDFLSPRAVLWSIANVSTWQWTGYNMIIIFAALQALPRDIFEAARVDGAGAWRVAWSIKIPLVLPAILLTALFSIIGTLQLFSEPLVLKTLTGNVTYNYTPNMMVYNLAFGTNDTGYASAVSVVIAAVTFIASIVVLRLLQKRGSQ
ncbi:carbohydrate ABC transporter permease [Kineococcus rhizosphaerae]|uniref:Carbohydrate ABC transporter membrane protein 1 (CUT1 family) n=1 Tax=Kineococcus rhizosphaerae TaxID=559628 RepID=A0A2T0QRC2_9ACTN|nr:sugar ABC transporter permease [Kineococcus rhizosphaerae]PRY07332.1 carbohydrate ABC transporter membrane protein 1 (CUT1 family) [Kineococcus rhizosphaerae]